MKIFFIAVALLFLAPIAINYGLLTWHMPGVQVENNPWLSFLGSYIAIFSAWSLSGYQYNRQRKDELEKEQAQKNKEDSEKKEQKEKEELRDRQRNRSYFTYQDIRLPADLYKVVTNPNSRIIKTEGYDWFKDSKTENYIMPYLRFNQYGASPFVIDVVLSLDWFIQHETGPSSPENIDVHLGIIEKDIEVYVPTIIKGMDPRLEIGINLLELKYTTLRGERMCLRYNGQTFEESCVVIHEGDNEECLYKHSNKGNEYIMPRKLNRPLKVEVDMKKK